MNANRSARRTIYRILDGLKAGLYDEREVEYLEGTLEHWRRQCRDWRSEEANRVR